MPYHKGKRVSLEVWRQHNPRNPTFRYRDGERYMADPGDAVQPDFEENDRVIEGIRQRQPSNGVRRAAIADALGLAGLPDGFETGGPVLPEPADPDYRPGEPATPRAAPATPRYDPRTAPEPRIDRQAAEKRATQWSEGLNLPKHNPKRRSQTPEGRRERYLRQKADRLGITYAEAEAMTPVRTRS